MGIPCCSCGIVAVVDVDILYYGSLPQQSNHLSSDHHECHRCCVVVCMTHA